MLLFITICVLISWSFPSSIPLELIKILQSTLSGINTLILSLVITFEISVLQEWVWNMFLCRCDSYFFSWITEWPNHGYDVYNMFHHCFSLFFPLIKSLYPYLSKLLFFFTKNKYDVDMWLIWVLCYCLLFELLFSSLVL